MRSLILHIFGNEFETEDNVLMFKTLATLGKTHSE